MDRERTIEQADVEILFPVFRHVVGSDLRPAAQSGDQLAQLRLREDLITGIVHFAIIEVDLDDELVIVGCGGVKGLEIAGVEIFVFFGVFAHGAGRFSEVEVRW